jgi:tetraacyldisaccharide 4'-kinase
VNSNRLRTKIEHWLQRQWQHRGVWAWSMAPLALLFGLILRVRAMLRQQRLANTSLSIPVVVVGNIYIGGTGKTPIVIALVKQLRALGWNPGVISRGYGTRIGDKPLVGQGALEASLFGDEPALIARESGVPIAVHPNRRNAYFCLIKLNPHIDVVISDDGLQHLRLHRDIEIVVQDDRGVGNGWLLPAGPLREPVCRLNTVQAIITRTEVSAPKPASKLSTLTRETAASLQIVQFRNLVSGQLLDLQSFLSLLKDLKVTAVAGIANPSRFFTSLHKKGIELSEPIALADHFTFNDSPFKTISADVILITAKDAVKCEKMTDQRLWVAEAEINFSDPDFLTWLDQLLKEKSGRPRND